MFRLAAVEVDGHRVVSKGEGLWCRGIDKGLFVVVGLACQISGETLSGLAVCCGAWKKDTVGRM